MGASRPFIVHDGVNRCQRIVHSRASPRKIVLVLALISLPLLATISLLETVEVLHLPPLTVIVGATALGTFLIGYGRIVRFDRESWS